MLPLGFISQRSMAVSWDLVSLSKLLVGGSRAGTRQFYSPVTLHEGRVEQLAAYGESAQVFIYQFITRFKNLFNLSLIICCGDGLLRKKDGEQTHLTAVDAAVVLRCKLLNK